MALKRITEVTIITSSEITETPHSFIEHDGAFYRMNLSDYQHLLIGNAIENIEAMIAEEFSTSSTYAVGDLVTYNGVLYECNTAITSAGAWNASKWTALDVATIIKTDTTLANRDRPADAKTVGDAIASTALTIIDPNNDGNLEIVPLAEEWSDEYLTASVVEAAENWLNEHVSSGDIIVDDTLSISGAAADAKKTGDEISDLKEDLNATTGLVNLTDQYAQGYIATSTSTIDITATHPTDTHMRYACLECSEGDVFHVKGVRYGAAYAIYCWVKADGTKISASADSELADWKKIVAPANTAYLVSNVSKSSDNYGLIKGQYLTDELSALEDALSAWNLYIDSDADIGYLSNTGVLTSPTKGDKTSDYIAVSGGDVLNIRTWATVPEGDTLMMTVCEYDSNKGFIIRRSKTGTSDPYIKWEYTAPSGVSYIRVSSRFFNDGKMMITRGAYNIGYVPASDDIALKSSIDNLSDGIESVKDGIVTLTGDEILTDGYAYGYIACNMSTININSVHQSNTYKYIVVPCSEGDVFNIIGKGDSTIYALYAFVDANGNKITGGKGQAEYTEFYTFKTPANTAYLVSNVNVNSPYALIKGDLLSNRITELEVLSASNFGLLNPLLRPANPKFIMHRGVSTQAPENTVPAFELAGQGGAWGIETDVYETTDGYFVLSHDNNVSRMTDGTGKITEMTYAQTQECTIDAGANVDQYPNLKMPLLEDYLAICRRYGCVPIIEIKGITNYDKIVQVVRKAGMEGSSVFTFYYDTNTITLLRSMTSMPILLIGTAVSDIDDMIDKAVEFTDLWLSLYSTTVTSEVVKNAHVVNVPVVIWAIDSESQADTFFRMGLDAIVSNSITKFST